MGKMAFLVYTCTYSSIYAEQDHFLHGTKKDEVFLVLVDSLIQNSEKQEFNSWKVILQLNFDFLTEQKI